MHGNGFTRTVFLATMAGLLTSCGGASARERALEETIAALQAQAGTVSASAGSMVESPAATAALTAGQALRERFVGSVHPPAPEGWTYGAGIISYNTCVNPRCAAGEVSYGIAEWLEAGKPRETGERMLWFERLLGYDFDDNPIQLVLDVMVWSETGSSFHWFLGGCRIGGEPDDEIVILYDGNWDPPSRAWRANHETGRFEEISTAGIVCMDENAVS